VPFRDLVEQRGHRRIVELLSRSVSRGTLPPSLIFCGPVDSGKRATAVALAQALNCVAPGPPEGGHHEDGRPPEGGYEKDACGVCAACTRIARGVHPDVLIVEPGDSGSMKIDQIRDVLDRVGYRPFEGRRRVVILDDADLLVPAAQNALLKVLEEPPASSVFVLITARPDMLLPTVRSRCVTLAFTAGAHRTVDEEARDVARRVLTQTAAADASAARRLDGAKELLTNTGAGGAADREQVKAHLAAMASLLRDLVAIGARADDAVLENVEIRSALERLAPAYQAPRSIAAFGAINTAIEAIERNAGVKIVADWLVLQL
jgi:DNA polymerase III subunit delta'